jgi:hypothetical protein
MCAFVFDGRCRKDALATLTEVKTYKFGLEILQLFHPFAIILIDEEKFQRSIPAYFARKTIPQMR